MDKITTAHVVCIGSTVSTRAYSKKFFGVHNFKSSCMM